jgi:hypothetical protein
MSSSAPSLSANDATGNFTILHNWTFSILDWQTEC